MPIQKISFQNNSITKQTQQQQNVSASPVATNSTGDTVEISTKKKENKVLKYTLIGVGALLGIVAIVKHKSIAKIFEKAPEVKPDVKPAPKETPKPTGTTSHYSTSSGGSSYTQVPSAKAEPTSVPSTHKNKTETSAPTMEAKNKVDIVQNIPSPLVPLKDLLKASGIDGKIINGSKDKNYQLWHFTSPAFFTKFIEMHPDISDFCKKANVHCHDVISLREKIGDVSRPNRENYTKLVQLVKEKSGVDLLGEFKHYRFISQGELDAIRTGQPVKNINSQTYSYVTLCPDYGLSCNTFDYRITYKNTPNILDNLDYYHDTQYKNGIKKPYSHADVEKVEKLVDGKWQEVDFLTQKEATKPVEQLKPSAITEKSHAEATQKVLTENEELLKYLTPEELVKYNENELVKAGVITPEMKIMFAKVKNLDGEEFIKTTYAEMTRMLGYEDCAPPLFIKNDLGDAKASYGTFSGKIDFDIFDRHSGKQFQMNSISTLRHELEHFIQLTTIARTEGLGLDAICRAKAKSNVKRLKIDKKLCMEQYNRPFEELDAKKLYEKFYNEHKAEINVPFYEKVIQKKGIIPKNSPEAKTAEEYYKALEGYTSACGTTDEALLKDYEDNLLEQKAHGVGIWLSNYFSFLVPWKSSKM